MICGPTQVALPEKVDATEVREAKAANAKPSLTFKSEAKDNVGFRIFITRDDGSWSWRGGTKCPGDGAFVIEYDEEYRNAELQWCWGKASGDEDFEPYEKVPIVCDGKTVIFPKEGTTEGARVFATEPPDFSGTRAAQAADETGEAKMIRIRNPWGRDGEWQGMWSDTSDFWDMYPGTKDEVNAEENNDGIFLQQMEDVQDHWGHFWVSGVGLW